MSFFFKIVMQMFSGVITRYFRMGASQFLRDFRRNHNLKRAAEHRKKILQKKQRVEERRTKVSFDEITEDRSRSKNATHGRLTAFVKKHGRDGMKRGYTKGQLHRLCQAYGVHYTLRSNKDFLARNLINTILECNCIPHPRYLDNLRVETCGNPESVTLRIIARN